MTPGHYSMEVISLYTGIKPTKEEVVKYSPTTIHYFCLWKQLCLHYGNLYEECTDTLNYPRTQFIVPEKWKPEILQLCHFSLLSGHLEPKRPRIWLLGNFAGMTWEIRRRLSSNHVIHVRPIRRPKKNLEPSWGVVLLV